MDNTLLRSDIDFESMKRATHDYLLKKDVLPSPLDLHKHTTATVIQAGQASQKLTEDMSAEMWSIATKYEIQGMHNAPLEPGVMELLNELHGHYCMVVVTNNAIDAAKQALTDNGIIHLFDLLIGREMMNELKPSPSGVIYALKQFNHLNTEDWVSVGDAWVDGRAALDAGVDFIAYRSDREKLCANGVAPMAEIQEIHELLRYV